MGSFSYRRSKSIGGFRFSLTPKGIRTSKRTGPVTFSSTGRNSIKLARGFRYRFGKGWKR